MIAASLKRIPLPSIDAQLLAAFLLLMGWGLVMVASSSVALAEKLTDAPLYFFLRQLVFAAVGLGVAALAFAVPMRAWEQAGFMLVAFSLFLLVVVLLPGIGVEVNNARRWIDLGLFRLQASEPARLGLVLYLAGYVVRRQIELQYSFRGLFKALIPIGLASGLLLLEPDFGATAILLAVSFVVLFLGGARLVWLLALAAVALGALALLATTAAYRLKRLLSYQDPWAEIHDGGWQLAQSLIAIGRGEWTGVGLGNSVQKLLYLPEQHTDFIFAILAEELGLLGVLILVALYCLLVWRGFVIGRAAERMNARFRAYVAYGLSTWIGGQALVNLAVNMGLVPTKGLTLPLMSYGGSSLITVCIMIALLLRVDHENRRESASRPVGVPE